MLFGTVTECCGECALTKSTKKCGCSSTLLGSIQPDVRVPVCYEDVLFCRCEVKSTRTLKVGDRVGFFYQWRVVQVTHEADDAELDTDKKKYIKKKDIKKKPTQPIKKKDIKKKAIKKEDIKKKAIKKKDIKKKDIKKKAIKKKDIKKLANN
jgi:hypothetical protein